MNITLKILQKKVEKLRKQNDEVSIQNVLLL